MARAKLRYVHRAQPSKVELVPFVDGTRFIKPMLLLRTDTLPDDAAHLEYQLKFDGYRALAFNAGGKIHIRSRNNNDLALGNLFCSYRKALGMPRRGRLRARRFHGPEIGRSEDFAARSVDVIREASD